ncbi:MAG: hypothetical protein GON13_01280 [Nanoarchaeota archaeon]|nr:hypothetical protein [Nanoarchaeota archaeon]
MSVGYVSESDFRSKLVKLLVKSICENSIFSSNSFSINSGSDFVSACLTGKYYLGIKAGKILRYQVNGTEFSSSFPENKLNSFVKEHSGVITDELEKYFHENPLIERVTH